MPSRRLLGMERDRASMREGWWNMGGEAGRLERPSCLPCRTRSGGGKAKWLGRHSAWRQGHIRSASLGMRVETPSKRPAKISERGVPVRLGWMTFTSRDAPTILRSGLRSPRSVVATRSGTSPGERIRAGTAPCRRYSTARTREPVRRRTSTRQATCRAPIVVLGARWPASACSLGCQEPMSPPFGSRQSFTTACSLLRTAITPAAPGRAPIYQSFRRNLDMKRRSHPGRGWRPTGSSGDSSFIEP